MTFTQQNKGKALIIAKQHVERRAISLDQLRFEQQRLGFAIGCYNLHRAALTDHTLKSVG